MGVDLEAKASLDSRPGKARSRKFGLRAFEIVEFSILASLLLFVIVSLFCTIALLGAKTLSNSLWAAKLYRRFFC